MHKLCSVLVVALTAACALPATATAHTIASYAPLRVVHSVGAATTSTNWSGYAAKGPAGTFKSISANWVQPTARCTTKGSWSAFWVGLDGYVSASVEQTGTSADCHNGVPRYYAWYEMFPKYPKNLPLTISPGDHISASVTTDGSGSFTLSLADTTTGKSFSTVQTLATAKLRSGEAIAEAPSSSSRILPLTNFGTVDFTAVKANGANIGASHPDSITMVSGQVKATPSALTGGNAFSVVWNHR